jgi:hypothetical protein
MSELFFNQRWRDGRAAYRPPDELIRTCEYDVAELPDDTQAKAFVLAHHYSSSYPAARWRFARPLPRRGNLSRSGARVIIDKPS